MSYRLEIYVSYQLKDWWKKRAAKNERSLSSEVRYLLEQIKAETEEKNNKQSKE